MYIHTHATAAAPLSFTAEWSRASDRVWHLRARRMMRFLSWWYLLSMLGVIHIILTVTVMLASPFVMQAAMQNPTFWISLVFSARARRARALVLHLAGVVRWMCMVFVGRRVVHYCIGGLIVPGTWLLRDPHAKTSALMGAPMKRLRSTVLQRCGEGRRWMTQDLRGQDVNITTADGAHLSAMLLRPHPDLADGVDGIEWMCVRVCARCVEGMVHGRRG